MFYTYIIHRQNNPIPKDPRPRRLPNPILIRPLQKSRSKKSNCNNLVITYYSFTISIHPSTFHRYQTMDMIGKDMDKFDKNTPLIIKSSFKVRWITLLLSRRDKLWSKQLKLPRRRGREIGFAWIATILTFRLGRNVIGVRCKQENRIRPLPPSPITITQNSIFTCLTIWTI